MSYFTTRKQFSFFIIYLIEFIIHTYKFKIIFICDGFENIFFDFKNQVEEFIIIEKKLFNKISFRSGSEKYLGIGYTKNHDLNNFKLIILFIY